MRGVQRANTDAYCSLQNYISSSTNNVKNSTKPMSTVLSSSPSIQAAVEADERLFRKAFWRLVPLLFICYVVNYMDRVNIGYAQLQMKSDLGFSDAIYGLGAGIFFAGYFLFEVPSNLLLRRIGARLTMARIMLCWGLASMLTMFVTTPWQFYVVRFLLGVFEAGFFPGIVLYLTFWFPAQRRARVVAVFMLATVTAGILTGPLSGAILQGLHGARGLQGWQWMFLLEGLPAVLLAVVVLKALPDGPRQASWLSDAEKQALQQAVQAEEGAPQDHGLRAALADRRIWLLSFIAFCVLWGAYMLSFWTPMLIKGLGVEDLKQIGLYSVIPNVLALAPMLWWGRRSDRHGERHWHFAVAAAAGSLGLLLTTMTGHSLALTLAALTLAGWGIVAALPVFWATATALLPGSAAAAGIALISSLANLAGLLSPVVVGALKTQTGDFMAGLYLSAALLLSGAIAMLLLAARSR